MRDLIETIKKIALDAVDTTNPVNILFGTVIKVNPLQINIEQRLTLDKEHLILTSLVSKFKADMTVDAVLVRNGSKRTGIFGFFLLMAIAAGSFLALFIDRFFEFFVIFMVAFAAVAVIFSVKIAGRFYSLGHEMTVMEGFIHSKRF